MGPYYLRDDLAHQLSYRKLYASIYFQYLDLARKVRFALDEYQSGARPRPTQNRYGRETEILRNPQLVTSTRHVIYLVISAFRCNEVQYGRRKRESNWTVFVHTRKSRVVM